MNKQAHTANIQETHSTVDSMEQWAMDTKNNDGATKIAIHGLAVELKADLNAIWKRYADGFLLDIEAHKINLSIVAAVIKWSQGAQDAQVWA